MLLWWIRFAVFIGAAIADKQTLLRADEGHQRRVQSTNNQQNVDTNGDSTQEYFRITVVRTIIAAIEGRYRMSDEEEEVRCIPIVDGTESNRLYSINLSNNFIKKYSDLIGTGKLYVAITNTRTIAKEERVVVTRDSKISIVSMTRSEDTTSENDHPNTTGQKTVAVVRISTTDASPAADAKKMQNTLFNPNAVNFHTQYMNCSFGQLEWILAPVGVVEVFVDQPVSDFKNGSALVSAAQAAMADNMGIEDPSTLGDKVIMCLPPGTGGWIASSGVNHWRAQFNDEWCLSLTATMHEV
jgi:hypothetical protein